VTELPYLPGCHRREFGAQVERTVPGGVVPHRTAFYPRGGGQPRDNGEPACGSRTRHVERIRRVGGCLVDIESLDLRADGGTHVANTAEARPIPNLDCKSDGRINKRLVVALEEAG